MAPFDVYERRRLEPGETLVGPAVVEAHESTVVLGPGATAAVDEHLNLVVELPGERHRAHPPDRLGERRALQVQGI